jgi:hypothetical protein
LETDSELKSDFALLPEASSASFSSDKKPVKLRHPKTPDVNLLLVKKSHSFNEKQKSKKQNRNSENSNNSPGKPRRALLLETTRNALNHKS